MEELTARNPAEPKDSDEGRYAIEEERYSSSHSLRISTIERQAAYIRAYNRYAFGFDIQS